jgi:hypothetical protein
MYVLSPFTLDAPLSMDAPQIHTGEKMNSTGRGHRKSPSQKQKNEGH